jgi:hypothetical protein
VQPLNKKARLLDDQCYIIPYQQQKGKEKGVTGDDQPQHFFLANGFRSNDRSDEDVLDIESDALLHRRSLRMGVGIRCTISCEPTFEQEGMYRRCTQHLYTFPQNRH